MLWTLLTLISSLTLIASSVVAAKQASAGFGGSALAVIIGLVLGACNAWALYRVGEAVGGRVQRSSTALQEWSLGALYLAAAAWALITPFVGVRVTSAAMRLIV
jgi:hypothetical protein